MDAPGIGGGNGRPKLVLSVKLWHFLIRWLLTSGLFSQKVCFLSLSIPPGPALFLEGRELALGMWDSEIPFGA